MRKCDLCNPENVISEYSHFTLAVSYAQPTLGKLIIVSRRHVDGLEYLTQEEWREWQIVYWDACRLLRTVFGADRVNFAYMNNRNKDLRHAHLHVIGRYEKPVTFAGRDWVDLNYGRETSFEGPREKQETINQIAEAYKGGLSIR